VRRVTTWGRRKPAADSRRRCRPRPANWWCFLSSFSVPVPSSDRINALVLKDPMMDEYKDKPMPYDLKRMAYGGFKVIVEERASAL
jgi:hypothetical protein